MKKTILLFIILAQCLISLGQSPANQSLFIIDSIPVRTDPEDWNQITQEDIADTYVLTNRDSLKLLGWEKFAAVAYIFTKAYRNRPDSLKKFPSLKQMKDENGVWHWNGAPYTGKYIDYYYSGRIQNEGMLIDGKLNGKLIVYFKNGNRKSVSDYKVGRLDGLMNMYYKNGALAFSRKFSEGKGDGKFEGYFLNGQKQSETKFKKQTPYDTIISFYSTGKISGIRLIKNGSPVRGKHENDINYYSTMFQQYLHAGNLKEANRLFYKRWLLDSISVNAHVEEGLLMAKELRFDEAIAKFDKALTMEPLLQPVLVQRSMALIKKYRLQKKMLDIDAPITIDDLALLSKEDQLKVYRDFLLADDLDTNDYYVKKQVGEAILNYCREKINGLE